MGVCYIIICLGVGVCLCMGGGLWWGLFVGFESCVYSLFALYVGGLINYSLLCIV